MTTNVFLYSLHKPSQQPPRMHVASKSSSQLPPWKARVDNVRGWLSGLLRRQLAFVQHTIHTSWTSHLQCHHHMTVVPVEQLMFRVHMQRALTINTRSHNKSREKTLEHVSRNLRQNSVRRCIEATHRKPNAMVHH